MNAYRKLHILILCTLAWQVSATSHAADNKWDQSVDEEEIFLRATDEVLNKGETYAIPFYLDRSASAISFGLYLVSPGNGVEFIGVEVPQITDFTTSDYFITDDFLSMVWLADPSQFGEGVPVSSTQPFLVVHIRANENVILHDAIAIGSQINPQFIPPSLPEYTIGLQWDMEIVSHAIDLPDGRQLELYPNPFTDVLYIDGLSAGDAGHVIIHNAAGQLINYLPLQESIDVSAWQDGLWYVSLQVDGVLSPATTVVKFQH
jgi:hypothetical protein